MLKISLFFVLFPLVLFSEIKIVLIGDSNTVGVPTREHGWAHFLKHDLLEHGYDVQFFNYGVGLATTDQCEQILNIALEAHQPDVVIYAGGLVDVLFNCPLDKMQHHIERTIQSCIKHDAVVLFGVSDFTCWEYKYQYNLIYLLQSNSVFLNIAYKCPVIAFEYLNSEVLALEEYNLGDWIHPNISGNRIVFLRIKEKLLDVLPRLHKPLFKNSN